MITQGFKPNFNTQEYIELMLFHSFPQAKINEIVAYTFNLEPNNESPYLDTRIYFGFLMCESGGSYEFRGTSFALTGSNTNPTLALFDKAIATTKALQFIGWQITLDNNIASIYNYTPGDITPPPPPPPTCQAPYNLKVVVNERTAVVTWDCDVDPGKDFQLQLENSQGNYGTFEMPDQRSHTYSNLSAGSYTIKLYARCSISEVSETIQQEFSIAEPGKILVDCKSANTTINGVDPANTYQITNGKFPLNYMSTVYATKTRSSNLYNIHYSKSLLDTITFEMKVNGVLVDKKTVGIESTGGQVTLMGESSLADNIEITVKN